MSTKKTTAAETTTAPVAENVKPVETAPAVETVETAAPEAAASVQPVIPKIPAWVQEGTLTIKQEQEDALTLFGKGAAMGAGVALGASAIMLLVNAVFGGGDSK